jgi:hypothetical protein
MKAKRQGLPQKIQGRNRLTIPQESGIGRRSRPQGEEQEAPSQTTGFGTLFALSLSLLIPVI